MTYPTVTLTLVPMVNIGFTLQVLTASAIFLLLKR
jgi:hypothetical protein